MLLLRRSPFVRLPPLLALIGRPFSSHMQGLPFKIPQS